METIYRTVDGKEFTNEACAYFHEKALTKRIVMIGYGGKTCATTQEAVAIILRGTDTAKILLKKARDDGDGRIAGIKPGDEGIFLWNNEECCYFKVSDVQRRVLAAAFREEDALIATEKKKKNDDGDGDGESGVNENLPIYSEEENEHKRDYDKGE